MGRHCRARLARRQAGHPAYIDRKAASRSFLKTDAGSVNRREGQHFDEIENVRRCLRPI